MQGLVKRLFRVLFCVMLMALSGAATAMAEKRVALIIGNGTYQHTGGLPNTLNDADAVASKLKNLGFEVTIGKDLDQAAMNDILKHFRKNLRGAEVALFYYAGHGMQSNGENYLIPVDAMLKDEGDLDFEAVKFRSKVLMLMQSAKAKIIILDACRDNPLAAKMMRGDQRSRSTGGNSGLSAIKTSDATGTMVAFATAPGKVALDGKGGNSPFTQSLLRHLDDKVDVDMMMKRVRGDVHKSTGQRQQPWTNSSINGDLYLAGKPAPVVVASANSDKGVAAATRTAPSTSNGSMSEITLWQSLDRDGKGTTSEYQVYLKHYPQGIYAAVAHSRIKQQNAGGYRVASADSGAGSITAYNGDSKVRAYKPNSPANQQAPAATTRNMRPADRISQNMLRLSRSDWREVQIRLIALGFGSGYADGIAGSGTRRDIRSWQGARGMPVSGYINDFQYRSLIQEAIDPNRLAAARAENARKSSTAAVRQNNFTGRKSSRRRANKSRRNNSSSAGKNAAAAGRFVGGVVRGLTGF